ncbi:MAG: 50S ribosomal protein L29 [Deltaproteobacteria bacterium]|nr:50S ribosomal protein L29 [Deltaproteobacteria bacterium]MBI3079445.1 50S ribosomal protein L29 [Deltaproteobacteria bacterium]
MTPQELRDLGLEELRQKERELQRELFNLRFQHRTNQLESPARLRLVRRDVARVKTLLRERAAQGG